MAKSIFHLLRSTKPQERNSSRLLEVRFLIPHPFFSLCMKAHCEWLSVTVWQPFISWLSYIFEKKQDPPTSVKEQLLSDCKRRDLICTLALSPITCVFASSQ